MNATPSPSQRELSRRKVLEIFGLGAAGAVGASVLSACGATEQGGGGAAGESEFVGAWPYTTPPKGHWNMMDGLTDRIIMDGAYGDVICLPGGMWYWDAKEWEWLLGESFEFDEAAKTATYKIKSGFTWNDGSPINADDVMATFLCRWIMRLEEWQFVNKVEKVDDQTVMFTMNNPSTVVERYVVRQKILPAKMYKQFADRAAALIDEGKDQDTDEGSALNDELQKWRPDDPEKDVLTSGPYRPDFGTITNAELRLNQNNKGGYADRVKFDFLTIKSGETDTISPLVLSKDVDYATHGFAVSTEKGFLKRGIRVIRPSVYSGPAVLFNLDTLSEFGDPVARRAIAHAINRDENGEISLADSGKGVKYMAGFSDIQVPDWLEQDELDQLDKYEYDQDKAAQLLEQAGWKRSGNKWMLPNGKPAGYELIFPSEFADWSAAAKNAAEQLSAFGIQVKPKGVTHTQEPIDIDKGNFQLGIQAWGAGNPHPHFAFVADFITHNIPIAKNQGGKGMAFELTQESETLGKVDIQQAVTAAGEGLDEDKQRENIATAALVFNELLPMVPLFERYGNNAALEGERVDKWPGDDDPVLQNSPYADNFTTLLILTGDLKPAK